MNKEKEELSASTSHQISVSNNKEQLSTFIVYFIILKDFHLIFAQFSCILVDSPIAALKLPAWSRSFISRRRLKMKFNTIVAQILMIIYTVHIFIEIFARVLKFYRNYKFCNFSGFKLFIKDLLFGKSCIKMYTRIPLKGYI